MLSPSGPGVSVASFTGWSKCTPLSPSVRVHAVPSVPESPAQHASLAWDVPHVLHGLTSANTLRSLPVSSNTSSVLRLWCSCASASEPLNSEGIGSAKGTSLCKREVRGSLAEGGVHPPGLQTQFLLHHLQWDFSPPSEGRRSHGFRNFQVTFYKLHEITLC